MNALENDQVTRVRWMAYSLLIAIAAGNMTGRIMAVNSVDHLALERRLQKETPGRKLQRPFLSANDRSRWANVRALVEYGTYAIDDIVSEPLWDTIDQVEHLDREGNERLYSSKPPLMATIIAGEYWVIHKITGKTLGTHPHAIGRLMLLTTNVLPMVVMFILLARLIERFAETDWARLFIMASATMGTLLTPFAVVLNNHTWGAVSVTIALYATVQIWCDDERRKRFFLVAGLAAAMAAACELPALSFFVAISLALLWKAPRQTLAFYTPAALVVVAAFFATNVIAHDSLRPPYMHRAEVDPDDPYSNTDDNWYIYEYERDGKLRASYWSHRGGIDKGEPIRSRYALHVLVGHHGIFSLTPIWIFSFLGMVIWIARGDRDRRLLAGMIAALSLVCILFFLSRPQNDRNYGGGTSGFRWLFWFAPMWLVTMSPVADWLAQRRTRRGVALLLLAASVFSASYPTWNPWRHPWLVNLLVSFDWMEPY